MTQTPLRRSDRAGTGGGGTPRPCPICRHGRGPRCAICGCLDVFHDLPKRKGDYVRTRCNHHPACTTYTPREEP